MATFFFLIISLIIRYSGSVDSDSDEPHESADDNCSCRYVLRRLETFANTFLQDSPRDHRPNPEYVVVTPLIVFRRAVIAAAGNENQCYRNVMREWPQVERECRAERSSRAVVKACQFLGLNDDDDDDDDHHHNEENNNNDYSSSRAMAEQFLGTAARLLKEDKSSRIVIKGAYLSMNPMRNGVPVRDVTSHAAKLVLTDEAAPALPKFKAIVDACQPLYKYVQDKKVSNKHGRDNNDINRWKASVCLVLQVYQPKIVSYKKEEDIDQVLTTIGGTEAGAGASSSSNYDNDNNFLHHPQQQVETVSHEIPTNTDHGSAIRPYQPYIVHKPVASRGLIKEETYQSIMGREHHNE